MHCLRPADPFRKQDLISDGDVYSLWNYKGFYTAKAFVVSIRRHR